MNDPAKVTLKMVAYIVGKIVCVMIAALLIIIALITAMYTMNVQVTVKDAFALRSSVMLKQTDNDDRELLSRVFSEDYLKKSGLYNASDNRAYEVLNYNEDIDPELAIVWPGVKKIKIKVKDVVEDVRAQLVSDTVDTSLLKDKYLMDSGEYDVTVVKTEDGWMIESLEMTDVIEPEVLFPLPTPKPAEETEEAETEGETSEGEESETSRGE